MSKFKGKFREWALATGLVDQEFFKEKIKVSKYAITGPTYKVKKSPESEGKKETEILNEILAYLSTLNCIFFRINTKGELHTSGDKTFLRKNSNVGMADILVINNGKCIWIEVKSNTGKQSAVQKSFEEGVKKHGADYILTTSVRHVREYFNDSGVS